MLLESHGLQTKVERGGRIFPVSDKAKDVVDTLVKIFTEAGGKLQLDTKVIEILAKDGHVTGVKTISGVYPADAVILAAGGPTRERAAMAAAQSWLRSWDIRLCR